MAAGDCDADGKADIITGAGPGGGPHVQVFTAAGRSIQSFYAFSPAPQLTANGVRVGCGDVDGDGRADLITACGPGDAPVVDCRTANDLANVQHSSPLSRVSLATVCGVTHRLRRTGR